MSVDIRICFVGDSFVNGTGDETALGWAGRLCSDANARGFAVTYYNLGVRRNTRRDVLRRWEHECSLRLPNTCDGRVVISCGVNDTAIEDGSLRVPPDESRANVREILRIAKKYEVLMLGPPPVADDEQNGRILGLTWAFADEAKLLGVPFIDLFSPLSSDVAYEAEIANNDGAHPKSGGYMKMANIVLASPSWWFCMHG